MDCYLTVCHFTENVNNIGDLKRQLVRLSGDVRVYRLNMTEMLNLCS